VNKTYCCGIPIHLFVGPEHTIYCVEESHFGHTCLKSLCF
jgi:hypothetical protein